MIFRDFLSVQFKFTCGYKKGLLCYKTIQSFLIKKFLKFFAVTQMKKDFVEGAHLFLVSFRH